MDEVFKSSPINLKPSVVPKTYYLRHVDKQYNDGSRHLKVTDPQQLVADPIIARLRGDWRYASDFAADAATAVVAEVVAETPIEAEAVAESDVIEVDLDADTLYIAAYEASMLYEQIDSDDVAVMTLEELKAYVEHHAIDIGRASAEETVRQRVTEWLDADAG